MNVRQVLERYPLFAALDGEKLAAWIAAGSEFAVRAGETLFEAGSPGLWIYVVLEGRVRVVRAGLLRDVSLGMYGPGEVIGDYALLPPGKNVSTCRMATDGRLFQLPLAEARPMIAAHKRIQSSLRRWVQLNALTAYLREQNFLGFMSAPSVLELREKLCEIEFPAGASMQAEGLADDRWFFIVDGEAELAGASAPGDGTGRRLGPGDCFGQHAFVPGGRAPHVIARAATRCLSLCRAGFGGTALLGEQSVPTESAESDFPWIGQEAVEDCGLAALAMIRHYHGQPVTVAEIRREAQIGRDGASLAELARLAGRLGLRAQAVAIHAAQYHLVRLPAIVHYRSGHYVVLYRYDPEGAILGDPAAAIVRLACEEFQRQASGTVLLMNADC